MFVTSITKFETVTKALCRFVRKEGMTISKNPITLAEGILDDAIYNAKNNRNRVAINRCYYAYFYLIRSLLLEKYSFKNSF